MKKIIGVRFDDATRAQLEALAEANGMTLSQVVRRAVRALQGYSPDPPPACPPPEPVPEPDTPELDLFNLMFRRGA